MVTPAVTELYAEHSHKAGILASARKDGQGHIAKKTLMTVWNNPVFLEATAQILSMISNVIVQEGSQGKDVKKSRTSVLMILVSEECALISCSDMNVFVSLGGQELIVTSTLTIVPALLVKTKELAWMK